MSGTNPPSSAGGPQSAAATARVTQNLKRSVQAAFDGKTPVSHTCLKITMVTLPELCGVGACISYIVSAPKFPETGMYLMGLL